MAYGDKITIDTLGSEVSLAEDNNNGSNTPGRGQMEVGGVADLETAQGNRLPAIDDELVRADLNSLPIINESQIKIDREVYARRRFNNAIDTEFNELLQKEETFNVKQFFALYKSLFFDIPALGNNSHKELRDRSDEFLGLKVDENALITELNNKIVELERKLLLANQVVPEHPFYRNNTLVKQLDSDKVYFMDKGFKRIVDSADSDWYNALRVLLGLQHGETPLEAPLGSLDQIPTGLSLNANNQHRQTIIRESQLIFADQVDEVIQDVIILDNLRERNQELEQFVNDVGINELDNSIQFHIQNTLNNGFESSDFPTVISVGQKEIIKEYIDTDILAQINSGLHTIITNALTLPEE